MPWSLTRLLRSKPWRTLAVVVSEMGSVQGTGMSMGMLLSGDRNGRGSGELVHKEGT